MLRIQSKKRALFFWGTLLFFLLVFSCLNWLVPFNGDSQEQLLDYFPRFHVALGLLLPFCSLLRAVIVLVTAAYLFGYYLWWQKTVLRNPVSSKEILLLLISVGIGLGLGEIALRKIFHFPPGYSKRPLFIKEVPELKLLKGYAADSNGIFRASPESVQELNGFVKQFADKSGIPASFHFSSSIDSSIYSSLYYSSSIFTGQDTGLFAQTYHNIISQPDTQRTDLQRAIVQFVNEPYNADGFRSIPFRNYASAKKKILLLGDSFTWGGVAKPISNSFADMLLAKGYAVYNTGIIATDPEQYRAIARKYIPILKPDIVIVNLFAGNDVMYYEREVKPYAPVYFPTNAGNIMACPKGVYFKNVREAYDVTLSGFKIPIEKSWTNRLCAQTSVTSVIWSILHTWGWIVSESELLEDYNKRSESHRESAPVCQRIVSDIKQLAIQNGAQFLYLQIPDLTKDGFRYPKDEPGYADTISYFTPNNLTVSDYSDVGGHFNNDGHRKYAAYIEYLIDSIYHR